MLDAITKQITGLQRKLGPKDRTAVTDYLESVREIERRIQIAERQQQIDLELPDAPVGIPFVFEEHIRLMYDLLVLAYQADITRVATFMVAREESNKTYPQIGVHEGHHATSHHQNRPEKIEKLVKIQQYHVELFGDFLKKLESIRDGDGTLLDHSLILFGSNMSNSNAHNHFPLPNLLVGGATGRHKGGRHLKYPDHTPMTNLILTALDQVGVPMDTLGDSTGRSHWRMRSAGIGRWRRQNRVVQAFRPAVSGRPEGLHYSESIFTRAEGTGEGRSDVRSCFVLAALSVIAVVDRPSRWPGRAEGRRGETRPPRRRRGEGRGHGGGHRAPSPARQRQHARGRRHHGAALGGARRRSRARPTS